MKVCAKSPCKSVPNIFKPRILKYNRGDCEMADLASYQLFCIAFGESFKITILEAIKKRKSLGKEGGDF